MFRSSRLLAGACLAGTATMVSIAAAPSAQAASLPSGVNAEWGTDGRVRVMLAVGDRVYVGGSFTKVIDGAGQHNAGNIGVYNTTSKRFETAFSATTDDVVAALAVDGSTLYLGGEFTKVKNVAAGHLAAVDANTGNRISSFGADASANVDALLVGNGALYASGNFKTINSAGTAYPRSNVARLSLSSGTPDDIWKPSANARVRTMAFSGDGAVFLGGSFSSVNGSGAHNKVGKVDALTGQLRPFTAGNTSPNGRQPVFSLAVGPLNQLVLAVGGSGGACTSMDSTGGTLWTRGTNGDAQAAEVVDNLAWCGGHFNTVVGQTRSKLAAFSLGGQLQSVSLDLNSPLGVWALERSGSTVFAGGDFFKVGQANVNHAISIG